jgi:tetratricopeptide (TPR) repeat protein
MILSLLVCVEASPAANAKRPRTAAKANAAAPAEAGSSDPCAVGPQTQGVASAAQSSSAVPLATLLNRTGSPTSGSAAPADASSPLREERNAVLSKQLWSTRITIPDTNADTADSLALKRLIRQVQSVKFAGKDAASTFTAPAESEPVAAASEPQFNLVQAGQTAVPATASTEAETGTPNKTRKTLEMLQQNPDQVRDPLEMAELLFLSGRPAEAAPFYARALDRISRADASYDSDRAWVLFQLGNCLRETDIAKAQETYMKLVSEYPASPWTELAKAHGRLLTWYQKSQIGQTATSPRM